MISTTRKSGRQSRLTLSRNLAGMFPLCFIARMERIDQTRIAEALLTAPGWARVGISAPTPWMREDAAAELARVIANCADVAGPCEPEQAGLTL